MNQIKTEITSPRFLIHFQPDLPVKLVCDASSYGVGAVLAHVMPDQTERPIAFASRSLNMAEKNDSQITEKEALAVIFGVKKFHMYLCGRKTFTLATDHKLLLAIVGPKIGLPTSVAVKLQRWAVILVTYSYDLEYRSTTEMGNADTLSCLPVERAPTSHDCNILLVESLHFPLTAKDIGEATKKDPILSYVLEGLISRRALLADKDDCKP